MPMSFSVEAGNPSKAIGFIGAINSSSSGAGTPNRVLGAATWGSSVTAIFFPRKVLYFITYYDSVNLVSVDLFVTGLAATIPTEILSSVSSSNDPNLKLVVGISTENIPSGLTIGANLTFDGNTQASANAVAIQIYTFYGYEEVTVVDTFSTVNNDNPIVGSVSTADGGLFFGAVAKSGAAAATCSWDTNTIEAIDGGTAGDTVPELCTAYVDTDGNDLTGTATWTAGTSFAGLFISLH